jgi:hypothetical protein
MITDIASFLGYFEGVNKRALRDIGSLPAAAETWRHDVHHRSQIDTYAGIAGWPVQQIFGRTAEQVGLQPRHS